MAAQRSIYAANNSSNHLPSYPQRPGSDSFEDYKPPAEDDIIDSYTTTAVPLPKQSYPADPSYPSLQGRQPPLYPPLGQKPSFQSSWENNSELHDGAVGSDYHLNPQAEALKVEKRSFLDTVRDYSLCFHSYCNERGHRFYQTQWPVDYMCSRCSSRQ